MKKKTENWLPVVGYEGRYSVSDHGNVMSMNYNNTGMMRLMVPGKDSYGYLQVSLQKDGKQATKKIHALVMAAFVGPRPLAHDINHKSGIKTENALTNLEYCTSSANRLHAYRIGTQIPMRGESHPNSKLDSAQVEDIKVKAAAGYTKTEIAQMHGVSRSTVSLIVNGKRWRALQ
jgi:hypothetical protein